MSRVNISTLNIQITASSQGLAQQVNTAVNQLKGLNNQLQNQNKGLASSFRQFEEILARSIVLYSAFKGFGALKDQLFDSVKLAADAETAAISFEVLLKSATDAKQIIEDLYQFVDETPFFSLEESRRAAQQLAAFGFETKKILPTLRSLADIAGSIDGLSLSELTTIFGKASVQGRLYTRDVVEFTGRGIPLLKQLAKQFAPVGTSVEEFQSQILKMAEEGKISFDDVEQAFAAMTSKGGDFDGFLARLSQTAAGQFSELQDKINRLKTEFGEGLIPTLNTFVDSVKEMIVAGDNGRSTLKAMQSAGEDLGTVLRITAGVVQYLRGTLVVLARDISFILGLIPRAIQAIRGVTDDSGIGYGMRLWTQELAKEAEFLFRSGGRLLDLSQDLRSAVSGSASRSGESLADVIGAVDTETQRARNQLEFLTQDAEKFAQTLRDKYKTPLEEFDEAVRQIIKADLLGQLKGSELEGFLAKEVERLNEATQSLKDTLSNPPAYLGSVEEVETRLRSLMAQQPQSSVASPEAQQTIGSIRAELEAEMKALKDAAEEQEKNTEALKDATNALKTFAELLNSPLLGPRYAIDGAGNIVSLEGTNNALPPKFDQSTEPADDRGVLDRIRGFIDGISNSIYRLDPKRNRFYNENMLREEREEARRQLPQYGFAPDMSNIQNIPPIVPPPVIREMMGPPRELFEANNVLAKQLAEITSRLEFYTPQGAIDEWRSARQYELEAGRTIDAEASGLLEALRKELEGQAAASANEVTGGASAGDGMPFVDQMEELRAQAQLIRDGLAELQVTELDPEGAAGIAYERFLNARMEKLEQGYTLPDIAPGLFEALRKELEAKPYIDSAGDASADPDSTSAKVEKLQDEVARLSQLERTLLERIATSSERAANNRTIVVKEYAA